MVSSEWLGIMAGDDPAEPVFIELREAGDKAVKCVMLDNFLVTLGRKTFSLAGKWSNVISHAGDNSPWLGERACGRGRILMVSSEICSDFHDLRYPPLRELFGKAVRYGLHDDLLIEYDGPASVEMTICRRGGDTYVHVVNLTADHVQDMWPQGFF